METLPLVTLALLGAYHGVNPAMGWLFAVARGMQDRSRRSVLRALLPIAVGHELAIAVVVVLVAGLEVLADPGPLRVVGAAALVGFGVFRFAKPRAHPRWTTMRVNGKELAWWSFLMSSAHGAGLMIAPVLLGGGAVQAAVAHDGHVGVESTGTVGVADAAAALTVHVGAMLVVMAIVSVLVYEKLGLAFLRRAWVNSDRVWAAAFVVAGVVTLLS